MSKKTYGKSAPVSWGPSGYYSDGDYDDGGYYGGSGYARRTWYDRAGLDQMVAMISLYDSMRAKLAREGGKTGDLRSLTDVLTRAFSIHGAYGIAGGKLSEPKAINKALRVTGQYDVQFEIRRTEFGLPSYYLARTHQDYWGTYGLQVEDIYRSDDFPLEDPRFVKFMDNGRGKYYLRLAPFRDKIEQVLEMEHQDDTDGLLYTLGRCVFQGAWHVDQRFSFMVADAYDIPVLKAVIELIYLCLGVDLAALRRQLTDNMLRFFSDVYPNDTLVRLLAMLPDLNDNQFAALSRNATGAYVAITDHFNRFLRTEVQWQALNTGRMPLWKPILANMKRLNLVADQTMHQHELLDAREALKINARECIQGLLNT